jgi:type IV pilus assembly protein PilV
MAVHHGHLRKDQKGFTLLEFLIAVMVLSVALLGLGTLTGAMINYNKEAFDNTVAVALSQGKMEQLKNIPYGSLTGGNDTQSPYTRTWTIDDNTPGTDMKTLTVTVTWSWKGDSKEVEYTSIVGK